MEDRSDSLEEIVADAEELLQRSGFALRQIQPAGQGSHHHLFVVEIDDGPLRLLRMPRRTYSRASAKILMGEAEAIERARAILRVPLPVILLPNPERPEASLMPIMPGVRGSDLRDRDPVVVESVCRQLGVALAKLHTVRLRDQELTRIAELRDFGEERVLLHGDAHLGNLLVEEEGPDRWVITSLIDWSFCRWGPPEVDLVEMAICEAEPRPRLGRIFYEAYLDAGGLPPREVVFRRALMNELDRRLHVHEQSHEPVARDVWTKWLNALRRPDASATKVFAAGRTPGRGMV